MEVELPGHKDKSDMQSLPRIYLWGEPSLCRFDHREPAGADPADHSPQPPRCPTTAVNSKQQMKLLTGCKSPTPERMRGRRAATALAWRLTCSCALHLVFMNSGERSHASFPFRRSWLVIVKCSFRYLFICTVFVHSIQSNLLLYDTVICSFRRKWILLRH